VPRPEMRRREEDGEVAITAAARVDSPLPRANGRAPARGTTRDASAHNGYLAAENGTHTESPAAGLAADGPLPAALKRRGSEARPLRIYAFGVSRNRLEHAIEVLRVPATVVRDAREADIVLTLKNYFRQRAQPIRDAETRGTPVYVLRSNTGVQMEQLLSTLFPSKISDESTVSTNWIRAEAEPARVMPTTDDPLLAAISEAEEAISSVIDGGPPVQLAPQVSRIRQVQHQLAERYALASRSRGREPHRRVEISRDGIG
jgi:hypothetical protein